MPAVPYRGPAGNFYWYDIVLEQQNRPNISCANFKTSLLTLMSIIDTSYILPDTVDKVLEYAHGKSALGSTLREGIVFRSQDGKVSFKAVDPLFLIKYDE